MTAQTVITSLDPNAFNTALQGGGTVTFNIDGTIVLTNTITISTNVILDGTNHSITISGGGSNELFQARAGINFSLRNLTLANGRTNGTFPGYYDEPQATTAFGGAIISAGNLDVEQCTFSNNVAAEGTENSDPYPVNTAAMGGAIYSTGALTITNSLFVNNSVIGGNGQVIGTGCVKTLWVLYGCPWRMG